MNALTIIAIFSIIIIAMALLYWWDIYVHPSCPECHDNLNSMRISRHMSLCSRHDLLFADPPKNRVIERNARSLPRQLFLK